MSRYDPAYLQNVCLKLYNGNLLLTKMKFCRAANKACLCRTNIAVLLATVRSCPAAAGVTVVAWMERRTSVASRSILTACSKRSFFAGYDSEV